MRHDLSRIMLLMLAALAAIGCMLALPARASAATAARAVREPAKPQPNIRGAVPGADVIIDAGHGGIDGGTHYNGIRESHVNLAISRKLYLLLRSHGLRTILNRTGDYALSDDNRWHPSRSRHFRDLTQRRGLSDEVDAGLLVSIHANWSSRQGTRGPLVIYRQGDSRGAVLAQLLQEQLNRQQAASRRPQATGQFYLLNVVRVPSAIVETGFLSNPEDRAMLTSQRGQTRIAQAIAAGILAYCSLVP